MTEATPLERAIELCSSQAELGRRIGRSQQNVAYWLKAKKVPAEIAIAIEDAVDGEVTRHELRPDIFGAKQPATHGAAT